MNPKSPRWKEITPSAFNHEREALAWVRDHLPDSEPWRAWSNFELIADDGSINEIDLLVLSPVGLFVVEIKSWRGLVAGDAATWTTKFDGRERVVDHPIYLTNLKAKRLKSKLQRQPSLRKQWLPFVEPLIFLSATDLRSQLDDEGRRGVHGRDSHASSTHLPGLVQRLTGEDVHHRGDSRITTSVARRIETALDEAGVRPSQRSRTVGDFQLKELLHDGDAVQDWRAEHAQMGAAVQRRVRIYLTSKAPGSEVRSSLERAARRELQILQGLHHPGILKALHSTTHELGPAIFFEIDPDARRLDHFLEERPDLPIETRLQLLRQLAETVRYAHGKRLFHRALAPQNVLVHAPDSDRPRPVVLGWQTGVREASTTFGAGRVTATVHPDRFVETAASAYLAPEVRTTEIADGDPAADLFSLGAITYLLFAGHPPAASHLELAETLRRHGDGLHLSASTDGVPPTLEALVSLATHPVVSQRLTSAAEFLEELEGVWDELTRPEEEPEDTVAPEDARRGDLLDGGWIVERRLGKGASSVVFLARPEGAAPDDESAVRVLKVAASPDHDATLDDEAEVLEQLRHHLVVELLGTTEIAGRRTLILANAGTTLAQRLREDGRISPEFLERWGEDLLSTVAWLEEKGIPHRDLKPDNLGVQKLGKNDTLHLVLFDFSLSRAPAEQLHAGTRPYLDPFLPLRDTPRWDLAAERFAAAVTLYEMATGRVPTWGDGRTDPQFVDAEADLATDRFYSSLREPLTGFFDRALRRRAEERFDNADEMLRAWRRVFDDAGRPPVPDDAADRFARVRLDSQVVELELSVRAVHALENLGVETVAELLDAPLGELHRMRGVGTKTRGEIVEVVGVLRARLGDAGGARTDGSDDAAGAGGYTGDAASGEGTGPATDPAPGGRATLVERLIPQRGRAAAVAPLGLLLGLRPFRATESSATWPIQSDVARELGLTRARIGQVLARQRKAWAKLGELNALRDDVADLLEIRGGVATAEEAAATFAVDEPDLSDAAARALVRAAWETEGARESPRWVARRRGDRVLLAREPSGEADPPAVALADWAAALGDEADRLALQEPLPSAGAVVEALRAIPVPTGPGGEVPRALPSARLVRLAAAASSGAAVSGRLELYPRGMRADRALRLAGGVLAGTAGGTIEPARIVERVASRYPAAERLPDHPALLELLRAEGFELAEESGASAAEGGGEGEGESGTVVYRLPGPVGLPSSTGTFSRISRLPARTTSPEAEDARRLQDRLERQRREGGLLLLLADPRHLEVAGEKLGRLALAAESFDRLFLRHLRAAAEALRVQWEVVLRADAAPPESRDRQNLGRLVDRALPGVERELLEREGTLLLLHPGLLARYDRLDVLERLRDTLSRPPEANGHRLRSLWVLLPEDRQKELPMLDGRAVPVIGPGDWARVPRSWLKGDGAA